MDNPYFEIKKPDPETCPYKLISETYSDLVFCTDTGPCQNKTGFSKRVDVKGEYVDVPGICTPI